MNDTTAPAINGAALASAQTAEQGALAVQKEIGLIPVDDKDVAAAVSDAVAKASTLVSAAQATTEAVRIIPPPRPIIPTVQSFGAIADGKTLNNAAFARAAASKNMLIDMPGTYLLDGVNWFNILQSGVTLNVTASGVVFRIRPNNKGRSYVIRISGNDNDLNFGDAQIYGDRDQHLWVAQKGDVWQEHGYGIFVGGARNRVRGLWDDANPFGKSLITNCTGDGIGVAGPGHIIEGFVSDRNRRQGCSAFECKDGLIQHCSFTNTGPYAGMPDPLGLENPFAGLDIEPDEGMGDVTGLRIMHNLIKGNRKSGLVGWIRAEVTSRLEFEAAFNVIQANSNGVHLKDARLTRVDTIVANLHDNLFVDQRNTDVRAENGAKVLLTNNTFDRIGDRADRPDIDGLLSPEMQRLGNAKLVGIDNNRV